jgi:DNA-binding transcriptional LysR family regulator
VNATGLGTCHYFIIETGFDGIQRITDHFQRAETRLGQLGAHDRFRLHCQHTDHLRALGAQFSAQAAGQGQPGGLGRRVGRGHGQADQRQHRQHVQHRTAGRRQYRSKGPGQGQGGEVVHFHFLASVLQIRRRNGALESGVTSVIDQQRDVGGNTGRCGDLVGVGDIQRQCDQAAVTALEQLCQGGGVAGSQVNLGHATLEQLFDKGAANAAIGTGDEGNRILEFLRRIEPILAAMDDAENSLRESGELRGLLRIAMPSTMGIRVVIPRLAGFTEHHPQLHLELLLEDRWQDMVKDAVDVGIRVGALPDLAGTARLIGTMHRVIVAAPAYLARHGTPETPEDLEGQRIIGGPAGSHQSSWQFERDGKITSVNPLPQISTNDTAGALAAAAGGLGIASITSWACELELASGALVQLLSHWKMAELPVHAYFPMGRTTRLAARAFADYLAEALT